MSRSKPSKASKSLHHGWTKAALERAIARHCGGHVVEAAEEYRRILAVTPEDASALHFLGLAEYQQGRPGEALALMDRAIALDPRYTDALVNRGNVLRLLGRHADAEANLRDAIALEPGNTQAHETLSDVLVSTGRIDEAFEVEKRILELRPPSGATLRRLGAALYARGRIADAADLYRRWLAIEPDNAEAKHLLAGCTGGDAPERAPDEVVKVVFDRMAASFDKNLARLEYRAPGLVVDALGSAAGAPAAALEVLDAGCGTGLCGPTLRPYARRLVGVDLSGGMLGFARERGAYDELVEAELTGYLREHPGAFDWIVSADTFVYFGALEALVEGAALALRPGGGLVFTVELSDEADAPAGHRLQPHGRYSHSARYVRDVLGGAGLAVSAVDEVQLRMEAGRWVRGLLATARRPEA